MYDSLQAQWRALDEQIRGWWDGDLRTAREQDICASGYDWTWEETIATISGRKPDQSPDEKTLLFLPFPFSPAAGNQGAFPEMFAWDTYFINLGLLAHGRYDIIRGHLLNQFSMIQRFGKVLNANRTYFLSRSQPPLHPDILWRFYQATGDRDILLLSYPLLRREYEDYWNNEAHQTPTGLTTNRDEQDPYLRPELASEAESGLDFCPLFEGDIRQCVPLATNAQLVRYAEVLSLIASELGFASEAVIWQAAANRRSQLIREINWKDDVGFFFEYNYLEQRHVSVWSLSAYWTMWSGTATAAQARQLVEHLKHFEYDRGLTFTDQIYPSPFPEFPVLQWSYPYCWPPMMMMVVEALKKYGYAADAHRIGGNYLRWALNLHAQTGKLWEKYVVVPGLMEDAIERYDTAAFHGWASAAVAVIGRAIGLDSAA